MSDIILRTFLRNLCADSAEVVQKFDRKAKSKSHGGNYYQSSLLGISEIVIKGAAYDQAFGRIANIKKDGERAHNTAAMNAFYSWWVDHKGLGALPPQAYMLGPKGKLRVRVHPDLMVTRGKKREIVLLWNYSDVLPQRVAGLGVYAMQRYLGPLGYSDCSFVVHDVLAGRRHLDGSIPDKAASILKIELARQEEASIAEPAPTKGPGL